MERVLLTGMSGTGKSTLICELAARGHKAIDTDSDEWSEWVTAADYVNGSDSVEEPNWVWREDRMQRLLSSDQADALSVSGCKSNQGKFYGQFDHVILLSAPIPHSWNGSLPAPPTGTARIRTNSLASLIMCRLSSHY